jgi:hypothetical protein
MSTAGQQLGIDMANNFMLMTLFSIVADMAENPEGFRSDVKKALLDLTEDYNLPGIAPETAREARDTAKQVINGILANANRSIRNRLPSSRRCLIFLIRTARDDLQGIIRQRPLQRLCLIPWRAHPDVAFLSVVRITGIAFGWIGSTIAFGDVVRKP